MQPNVTPGAILELHAARANNGLSQGINSPLTTTWKDTSGNGNDGTLTGFGGTTASGWAGSGTGGDPYRLVFDTTDDSVTLPAAKLSSQFSTKVFSIEAWLSTAYFTTDNCNILVARNNNFSNAVFFFGYTGRPVIRLVYAGVQTQLIGSSGHTIDNGAVHHVVAVADGTALRLFVDGSEAGTSISLHSGSLGATSTTLLGYDPWPNQLAWKESIIRVYPFAFTSSQVTANYNAGPTW